MISDHVALAKQALTDADLWAALAQLAAVGRITVDQEVKRQMLFACQDVLDEQWQSALARVEAALQ